jgi:phage-related protein
VALTFTRPYTIRGCGYGCPAVLDAVGRSVAMGSQEMCEDVVAGRCSTVERQGELWSEDGA